MRHAMYQFERTPPAGNIKDMIDRLRSLADDLERASEGKHPSEHILEHAPVLNDWQFGYRPEMCLYGTVSGHPDITDGRLNRTSGLWLISREFGYARTLSRVYALASPNEDPHFRNY